MLKTADTAGTVAVEPFSESSLLQCCATPCVLSVNVDTECFGDITDHGFTKNVGHSVVCLRQIGHNRVSVFDPSPDFGIEDWGQDIFQAVTSGVILRFVPRDAAHQRSARITRPLTRRFAHGDLTARL